MMAGNILSPLIPGFNPMQMNSPKPNDPAAQNAMSMKLIQAALGQMKGGAPNGLGAAAANTGIAGGGYAGPGGEVQPGPGFYPGMGGGMTNTTGGIGGLLGGGAGGMGLLGKMFAKKPIDPSAMDAGGGMVDPTALMPDVAAGLG